MSGWGAVLSGALTGGLSMLGQQQANEANAKEAKKNREFQADMSDTAHQRETKDLIAAGLNPILSANAGASTPAGATATMENALGAGASSALEGYRAKLETQRLKGDLNKQNSEISLLNSQKKKTDTENVVLKKDIPKSEAVNTLWDKFLSTMETSSKKIKQIRDDKKYMDNQRKGLP